MYVKMILWSDLTKHDDGNGGMQSLPQKMACFVSDHKISLKDGPVREYVENILSGHKDIPGTSLCDFEKSGKIDLDCGDLPKDHEYHRPFLTGGPFLYITAEDAEVESIKSSYNLTIMGYQGFMFPTLLFTRFYDPENPAPDTLDKISSRLRQWCGKTNPDLAELEEDCLSDLPLTGECVTIAESSYGYVNAYLVPVIKI